MKILKFMSKLIIWISILSILIPGFSWLILKLIFSSRIQEMEKISNQKIAIVFGAGLRRDGSPTPILQDRVKKAVQLYQAGKVKKLLFSGDNRFIEYNEPGSMRAYAISLGVPSEDIVLDYAGRRTYDTCYRARHIFQVEQAVLITQNYHLPRALFLCQQMGIKANGINADLRQYSPASFTLWNLREILATSAAMIDVWIRHPIPVLGEPQPIEYHE